MLIDQFRSALISSCSLPQTLPNNLLGSDANIFAARLIQCRRQSSPPALWNCERPDSGVKPSVIPPTCGREPVSLFKGAAEQSVEVEPVCNVALRALFAV